MTLADYFIHRPSLPAKLLGFAGELPAALGQHGKDAEYEIE